MLLPSLLLCCVSITASNRVDVNVVYKSEKGSRPEAPLAATTGMPLLPTLTHPQANEAPIPVGAPPFAKFTTAERTALSRPKVAPFWTTGNRILVPAYLVLQGADAWATEHNANPHAVERNPLIPSTRVGRVAYFSATAAAVVGGAWLLHRSGHPKAARIALAVAAAVEGQAAATSWGEW